MRDRTPLTRLHAQAGVAELKRSVITVVQPVFTSLHAQAGVAELKQIRLGASGVQKRVSTRKQAWPN